MHVGHDESNVLFLFLPESALLKLPKTPGEDYIFTKYVTQFLERLHNALSTWVMIRERVPTASLNEPQ